MAARWLLVFVAACGRIGFDERTIDQPFLPPIDLADFPLVFVDPATLPPFGPPTLVSELSLPGVEDDDPALSRDQLEIFFDREIGGHDLYTARRASIDEPWSEPVLVAELDSNAGDEHPALSPDGLTLFYASGRDGEPQIFFATRPDRNSRWSTPVVITELGSTDRDENGGISGLGTSYVLASRRAGGVTDDLYEATRADGTSPWNRPVRIDALSVTGQFERSPTLDDLGLVLHWDRGSTEQIVWTIRTAVGMPWSGPFVITEIDDAGFDESDPWLSPDLRTLYFTREVDGTDSKDIYTATR